MKIIVRIILIVSVFAANAPAGGFKMGLGNAVAETGTEVFREATEIDRAVFTGDTVANLMPSCNAGVPYRVSPIVMADLLAIEPLGHTNPSGHTFPTDHIYFDIDPLDPLVP